MSGVGWVSAAPEPVVLRSLCSARNPTAVVRQGKSLLGYARHRDRGKWRCSGAALTQPTVADEVIE
jgi:hypothetical protein